MFEQNINNKVCLPVFVYLRNKKTTATRITTKVNPPAAALPTIIGNLSLDSAIKKRNTIHSKERNILHKIKYGRLKE